MTNSTTSPEEDPPRPTWEDPYLEEVANRLMFSYDLEREFEVDDRTYEMYGIMQVESRTHIFHPLLNYGNHFSYDHLFVSTRSTVEVTDLEAHIELGHELADRWIATDEEHYNTDFTFVFLVSSITDEVTDFVESFELRKLLKLGYHGHYEINLVVVAPEREEIVASQNADVHRAFSTWKDVENVDRPGFIGRVLQSIRG